MYMNESVKMYAKSINTSIQNMHVHSVVHTHVYSAHKCIQSIHHSIIHGVLSIKPADTAVEYLTD